MNFAKLIAVGIVLTLSGSTTVAMADSDDRKCNCQKPGWGWNPDWREGWQSRPGWGWQGPGYWNSPQARRPGWGWDSSGDNTPGTGRGQGRGQGRNFLVRFTAIDANDDGRISDDEAAANRENVFASMDGDDNGKLTQKEYMALRMGPQNGRNPARQKQKQEQKAKRFAPMDTDKSGDVSKTEWMEAGRKRFALADADKNGKVTPWEFRAMHRNR